MIMMYQHKFINCNCVPVCWGILIMGESVLTGEQEEYGKHDGRHKNGGGVGVSATERAGQL